MISEVVIFISCKNLIHAKVKCVYYNVISIGREASLQIISRILSVDQLVISKTHLGNYWSSCLGHS